MRKFLTAIFIALSAFAVHKSFSWGFWAHQRINRMAVFSLPPAMFGFFKHYIDYVTVHAVDPDKRRYAVEGEAACHYIDLDRYGENPFDSIPRKWNQAVAKYSEDTLLAHGIVPWHIERMMFRLTQAFRERNRVKILKYASDLGHYIGDAHVPLHCTSNYNGQLTNQHGIHGFWESRIPEISGEGYDYITGRCRYITDPLEEAWTIVEESYAAHDSVLKTEKTLSENFPPDRKFSVELKGKVAVKVYSREYALAYEQRLNGMVERRMRDAIHATASFWYTAWVNAGQPTLELLIKEIPSDTLYDSSPEFTKKIIPAGGHID